MTDEEIDAMIDPALNRMRVEAINKLTAGCANILRGYPPEVQSATLAHLVALNLAGHQPTDGIENADMEAMREGMLGLFVDLVRHLMPTFVEELKRATDAAAKRNPPQ